MDCCGFFKIPRLFPKIPSFQHSSFPIFHFPQFYLIPYYSPCPLVTIIKFGLAVAETQHNLVHPVAKQFLPFFHQFFQRVKGHIQVVQYNPGFAYQGVKFIIRGKNFR